MSINAKLEAKGPGEAASILVVDDEAIVLRTVRRTLLRCGFTNVLTASSGREALGIQQTEALDLVMLDLNMPEMNGLEVLRALLQHTPALPVIIVTAVEQAETVVRCLEIGAVDCLIKPTRSESLIGAVRRALEASRRRARIGLTRAKRSA